MIEALIFYPTAALILLSSLMVVLHPSPIRAALFLLGTLFFMAFMYVLLSANFVAVIQILVYAGGIVVLILFAIMILDMEKERLELKGLSLGTLLTALLSVFLLMGLLVVFGTLFLPKEIALPEGFGTIEEVGRLMITDYVYAFEAISILVIASLVGAVVLARGVMKKRGVK
jgi:NADH-quinone oxidoreductase subunit J